LREGEVHSRPIAPACMLEIRDMLLQKRKTSRLRMRKVVWLRQEGVAQIEFPE